MWPKIRTKKGAESNFFIGSKMTRPKSGPAFRPKMTTTQRKKAVFVPEDQNQPKSKASQPQTAIKGCPRMEGTSFYNVPPRRSFSDPSRPVKRQDVHRYEAHPKVRQKLGFRCQEDPGDRQPSQGHAGGLHKIQQDNHHHSWCHLWCPWSYPGDRWFLPRSSEAETQHVQRWSPGGPQGCRRTTGPHRGWGPGGQWTGSACLGIPALIDLSPEVIQTCVNPQGDLFPLHHDSRTPRFLRNPFGLE